MLTYTELLNEIKQRPTTEQLALLAELAHLLQQELLNAPAKPAFAPLPRSVDTPKCQPLSPKSTY